MVLWTDVSTVVVDVRDLPILHQGHVYLHHTPHAGVLVWNMIYFWAALRDNGYTKTPSKFVKLWRRLLSRYPYIVADRDTHLAPSRRLQGDQADEHNPYALFSTAAVCLVLVLLPFLNQVHPNIKRCSKEWLVAVIERALCAHRHLGIGCGNDSPVKHNHLVLRFACTLACSAFAIILEQLTTKCTLWLGLQLRLIKQANDTGAQPQAEFGLCLSLALLALFGMLGR